MAFLRSTYIITLTAVSLMLLPGSAGAAVEIGSRCVANSGGVGTRVQTVDGPAGPSYTAPISGVIVKWGTALPAVPVIPVKLKLVRPGALPNTWTVVGQTASASATTGENTINSNLRVTAGDRIAIYSSMAAVGCSAGVDPAETTAFEGAGPDTADGGTVTLSPGSNSRLALFAIIEPDADGDGFGDESQDLCPQSAMFQTACPIIKLTKVVLAGRQSLNVYVTSAVSIPATLTGSARVPASGGKRAATIKFKALTKTVAPGAISRFTLKQPAKLKSALRRLPRGTKVKLTLKLTAVGIVNTDTQTVRATWRAGR